MLRKEFVHAFKEWWTFSTFIIIFYKYTLLCNHVIVTSCSGEEAINLDYRGVGCATY